MQLTSKKPLIIGSILLLLIIFSGAYFFVQKKQSKEIVEPEQPVRRRISEPVNVIDISQRPVVSIIPHTDGNHLTIKILSLNKPANSAHYLLEYQAGSSLRGLEADLELATLPVETEVFLGSCSAGGACTYDKDITGGNLLLTFIGDENYAVKTNWRYIENIDRSDSIASWDAKFQLESSALSSMKQIVVFNSPGYPTGIAQDLKMDHEPEIIGDHYAVSSTSSLSGEGKITIRLATDSPEATIIGYDGESWQSFPTTVQDKQAIASVKLLEFYTVIR